MPGAGRRGWDGSALKGAEAACLPALLGAPVRFSGRLRGDEARFGWSRSLLSPRGQAPSSSFSTLKYSCSRCGDPQP